MATVWQQGIRAFSWGGALGMAAAAVVACASHSGVGHEASPAVTPASAPRATDHAGEQAAALDAALATNAADAEADEPSVPSRPAVPALIALGHGLRQTFAQQRHTWQLFDGKHWQVRAQSPPPATTEPSADGACRPGMREVKGDYLLDARGRDLGDVATWQDSACAEWRPDSRVCEAYDPQKWATLRARGKRRAMHLCMDEYEYPNARGENPLIVVTFGEAERACKKQKKRLCTESEWTFACEGEDALPYPYGYRRDAEACRIDVLTQVLKDDALWPRNGAKAARELDRAWQGVPSGSMPACVSPFGVHDMTGNVDEWTRSVVREGQPSILKGGFWSKVRARCRPATRAHGPTFVAYQQGFRCCADPDPR